MEVTFDNEGPRLVEISQGLSVLNTVEYKHRFLYSKYNPTKSILSLIEKIEILPGTLIIINSPALWYGIKELKEKIPSECKIMAVEADEQLFALAKENMMKGIEIPMFRFSDADGINNFISYSIRDGKIRRPLRLDFSGGVQFAQEQYNLVYAAAQDIIGSFWKNRVTLVRMGKLFSKNVIKNLRKLDSGRKLSDLEKTVSKPIIVCGAGESLDTLNLKQEERENYYILCVDAALSSLRAKGIHPDGAVAVESQFAIQKAYIGEKNTDITLFADLCSRYEIPDFFSKDTVWFMSKFADVEFLGRIKDSLKIDTIDPMGSVGLYATFIGLKLRQNESIPVYVTGLDFSYSCGRTHSKDSPAHKSRLSSSTRIAPADNYDAAFGSSSIECRDKFGNKSYSNIVMEMYSKQFQQRFGNTKNLIDIGNSGLNLNIARGSL